MNFGRDVWLTIVLLCALSMVFAIACETDDDDDNDDDDDTGDDTDDDQEDDDDAQPDDDDDDSGPPPPGCDTLQQGWNTDFMVDDVARSFFIDLPEGIEESWPWAVVFNWHGYGDTATNMRGLISNLINDDEMPFIAITPEDSGMMFDWDIFDAANPDNREVRLFDDLLAELDKCWGVDYDHVHSTGFSFGCGISNMLGVTRGDVLASIGCYSGVYGSNPENSMMYAMSNWPELTTANKYAELRIHGGAADWMVLPFGQYAENDRTYLNADGHDVVICNHGSMHNMGPTKMHPSTIIEFFADHPMGTHDSPYAAGLPGDYPGFCEFSPKD